MTRQFSAMAIRTFQDCDDVFERNLVREVAEQGWSVVHSVAAPGHQDPSVAYSAGLWLGWQHPEVLVFGLQPELAQALLRLVCEEVKGGHRFLPRQGYDQLLEGQSCRFEDLDPSFHREYLGYCRWFYRGDGFRAVQLMWPDELGHFPDQAGFNPSMLACQPVLLGGSR